MDRNIIASEIIKVARMLVSNDLMSNKKFIRDAYDVALDADSLKQDMYDDGYDIFDIDRKVKALVKKGAKNLARKYKADVYTVEEYIYEELANI